MNCTYCSATGDTPNCTKFDRKHPVLWTLVMLLHESGHQFIAGVIAMACGAIDADVEPETVTLCASGFGVGRQCNNEAFAIIASPSGMLDVSVCPECAVRPEYHGWTIRALGQGN